MNTETLCITEKFKNCKKKYYFKRMTSAEHCQGHLVM